jgi:hypothetical protein
MNRVGVCRLGLLLIEKGAFQKNLKKKGSEHKAAWATSEVSTGLQVQIGTPSLE